ncbi:MULTISPECIES: anhydro-N-acetylmuramic acid kinase [unclassified Isoptericola]|uniref:anhydro-N-acetylmuramic acid kinase n=1 Tax=unclassified Isoptericola TaxID=2623355 RepID=UPI0036567817
MIVIGVSSGTSVDAIDAAAADLDLRADGTLHLRPLGHAEYPWPDHLRRRILAALPPAPVDMGEVCQLDTLVGQELGAAARRAVDDLAGGDADLVASHGQTLHHWVVAGRTRGTLQLGNPAWVAERSRRPVVSDFRVADVAAGGQGAPLVSVLDALWLGHDGEDGARDTAALNVGGIANVTVVGAHGAPVLGWDTGPGNCLVDHAVQRLTGRPFDRDGELAAQGAVDRDALDALLGEPYYDLPVPRSTGRELYDGEYVATRLAATGLGADRLSTPDLVATLTELTAVTVARSLAEHGPAAGVGRVVISGGGARNPVLVERLRAHLPATTTLVTSDELGMPVDGKEAYLFALLGFLGVHGVPGTAAGPQRRQATGARRPVVLGSLTPPTPLPVAPVRGAVTRLVLATSPPDHLARPRHLTTPRGSTR